MGKHVDFLDSITVGDEMHERLMKRLARGSVAKSSMWSKINGFRINFNPVYTLSFAVCAIIGISAWVITGGFFGRDSNMSDTIVTDVDGNVTSQQFFYSSQYTNTDKKNANVTSEPPSDSSEAKTTSITFANSNTGSQNNNNDAPPAINPNDNKPNDTLKQPTDNVTQPAATTIPPTITTKPSVITTTPPVIATKPPVITTPPPRTTASNVCDCSPYEDCIECWESKLCKCGYEPCICCDFCRALPCICGNRI